MASMENIVRPWVVVSSFPKPRDRTPPPQDIPPAHLRWGQASDFGTDDFRSLADDNKGFHTEDDKKPKRVRLNFSESGNSYEDIRVENPDDADQYVIVRAPNGMVLSGPNGVTAVFSMSTANDTPGTIEGDGQSPEGTSLEDLE